MAVAGLTTRAVGPAAAAAFVWRVRSNLVLTVAVKATFRFAHRAPASRAAPRDIVGGDVSFDRDPSQSVEQASEMVPLRAQADITFVGHAYAPGGRAVPAMAVRLALFRGSALVDKTLQIFGDRAHPSSTPLSFVRMPIRYERGAGLGAALPPNVLDARDPRNAAGFGPTRTRSPTGRDGDILELDDGVDWNGYAAAPIDQRTPYLRGDEWIVLDGLHPTLPRLETQIPSARGLCRVSIGERVADVELHADTLSIDGDAELFSVVWRGRLSIPDLASLATIEVIAGVESNGQPLIWPEPSVASAPELDLDATAAITPEQQTKIAAAPTTPFAPSTASVLGIGAPPSIARPQPPAHLRTTASLSAGEQERAEQRPTTPFEPSPVMAPPAAPETSASTSEPRREEEPDASEAEHVPTIRCPERTSPAIPVFNRTTLQLIAFTWQVSPPQESLTVCVKGTFDLVPDGPAVLRAETEVASGDLHLDDDRDKSLVYPSDFAIFKPRADVALIGSASGGRTGVVRVAFAFGHPSNRFVREIAVFGERRWQTRFAVSELTSPEPFERIPLTYERAFGGPGFDDNPVGAGLARPGAVDVVVPNLEDPAALITSPRAKPAPACFAPIPLGWRERQKGLGTFDARWQKTRWPYFPDDFDWTSLQAAPRQQQLRWLEGDEPFEIVGVLPERTTLRGTLPGVRLRCLVEGTEAAGGALGELALHLDTVLFDVDGMKLTLVWRGLLEVADDEASEIAALMLASEPLSQAPAPIERVRAACLAPTLLEAAAPPPAPAVASDAAPEPPEVARIKAEMDARIATAREAFAKHGVEMPKPEATRPEPPSSSPPHLDAATLAANLRSAGVAEEEVEKLTGAVEDAKAEHAAAERGPVPVDIRARVVATLEAGGSFDGADLGGADLAGLDFTGRSLREARLQSANLAGSTFAGADLRGAQLGGADLEKATLAGAHLEAADFHGANLGGATLDDAWVERASFARAKGDGASFRNAKGGWASFADGSYNGARFDRATLPAADFTRASLDDASFVEAKIAEVRLFDARGAKTDFSSAELPGARADGSRFRGASFSGANATRSTWEGALLDQASFVGANLGGTSLIRASCRAAVFSGAEMTEARCARASFAGAKFIKANLMKASLARADLTDADLRGANLHGAETWNAKLDRVALELAIVTQSKLARRG